MEEHLSQTILNTIKQVIAQSYVAYNTEINTYLAQSINKESIIFCQNFIQFNDQSFIASDDQLLEIYSILDFVILQQEFHKRKTEDKKNELLMHLPVMEKEQEKEITFKDMQCIDFVNATKLAKQIDKTKLNNYSDMIVEETLKEMLSMQAQGKIDNEFIKDILTKVKEFSDYDYSIHSDTVDFLFSEELYPEDLIMFKSSFIRDMDSERKIDYLRLVARNERTYIGRAIPSIAVNKFLDQYYYISGYIEMCKVLKQKPEMEMLKKLLNK